MNSSELRNRLQEVTLLDISVHEAKIEALKQECPHSIRLIERANPERPRNCYEFALDVDRTIAHEVGFFDMPDMYVGPKFFMDVMLPCLTEIDESRVKDGDLAIYFKGDTPQHAGIVRSGRIISKWGIGHVYEHQIWEVPSRCGDHIRFYSRISPEVATDKFLEYVRSHPDFLAIKDVLEYRLGRQIT